MIRACMLVVFAIASANATTVIKASLDDLIDKSTSIVRAKITGSYTSASGPAINTYYKIQVEEVMKGSAAAQVDVRVPGGSFHGVQQNFAGAPQLATGAEYVLFLWKGPSGTTHLLGLSQGVLDVTKDTTGNLMVVRQPIDGLDSVRMKLSDLATKIK